MIVNDGKKIKELNEKIDQIKKMGDRRNWFNLSDKEMEAALNTERRWKGRRITELNKEIVKLKEK